MGAVPGLMLTFAALAVAAAAQQAAPAATLVGTWEVVRVDNVLADGSRVRLYGDAPKGLLMFDAAGRYSLQIVSSGRPRFAANDKAKGTPDEYRAALQGSNAHFGRYRVEGASLVFQIEHASFPNWEGTEQKRPFTLVGDELTYVVPAPTTGGGATGDVAWRRR